MAIMEELVTRGIRPVMTNRRGVAKEPLPEGVTVVAMEATDPDQVAAVCQDATVVFNTTNPPYAKWPELFPPLLRGVIAGLSRTNATMIFSDNLYMYGPTHGQLIREDLPYAATGRKGVVRAQMATELLAAHQTGKIRVAIGRASDFYGPRVVNSVLGEQVFKPILQGKPANLLGNIDQPHTFSYIRDFATALITLSEQEAALGRAWHIPNAPTVSTRQILQLIEAELQHPVKHQAAGRLLVTVLSKVNPILKEFPELMYEWEEPYIVDHSQFAAAFGAQITPLADGLKQTIAWYRQALAG